MADFAVDSYNPEIASHEREPSPAIDNTSPAEEPVAIASLESSKKSKKAKKAKKKQKENLIQLGTPRLSLSYRKEPGFEDEAVATEPYPVADAQAPVPLECEADGEETLPEVEVIPEKEESAHNPLAEPQVAVETNDGKLAFSIFDMTLTPFTAAEMDLLPPAVPEPEAVIYLPFSAQHKLMVHLQQRLEDMCFSFAQRAMPDLLERRGWHCAEMAELQHWMKDYGFQEYVRNKVPDQEQSDQLLRLSVIRNCAVNRKRIDTTVLGGLLFFSLELAKVLEEPSAVDEIAQLRDGVIQATQRLAEETQVLHERYDTKLQAITAARAKLNIFEEKTNAELSKRLEQSRSKANGRIITLIREAECSTPKAAPPGGSMAGSCLDWVNDLESSLALEEDDQEDVF
ncbi:hypothetical protein IL306_009148 [Fusarium sp. DS 682]|nr:hypothetical protein IL306_009148 [Fusarium sp. DS 682]